LRALRLARAAEADLDEIAFYVATESGSLDMARQVVESITARFPFLAENPYAGRARDSDFGHGRRSFPVDPYLIVYRVVGAAVLILRVVHGRRDLPRLLRRAAR
jgi:toxin ParE1/3/4